MISRIYLVKYQNKIIGTYLQYETAELFVLSCLKNNLMKNHAIIIAYQADSCVQLSTKKVKIIHDIDSNSYSNSDNSDNNSDTGEHSESENKSENKSKNKSEDGSEDDNNLIKLINKKKKLNHKLNIINYNKKKFEEALTLFNSDKLLYEQFSNFIKNDPLFEIPELFKEKYIIFDKLNKEDRLTFNDYNIEIIGNNPYIQYQINTPYNSSDSSE